MSEKPVDEEELRLKTAFRAFQRKAAAVMGAFGLGAGLFLYSVQKTLASGMSPWGFRGLLAVYAAFGLYFSYKRRWGLAAVMTAWMVFTAAYLSKLVFRA